MWGRVARVRKPPVRDVAAPEAVPGLGLTARDAAAGRCARRRHRPGRRAGDPVRPQQHHLWNKVTAEKIIIYRFLKLRWYTGHRALRVSSLSTRFVGDKQATRKSRLTTRAYHVSPEGTPAVGLGGATRAW